VVQASAAPLKFVAAWGLYFVQQAARVHRKRNKDNIIGSNNSWCVSFLTSGKPVLKFLDFGCKILVLFMKTFGSC